MSVRAMSIIKDLYSIFDNERDKYIATKSSKNLVLRELAENLAFLREGLAENLKGSEIIECLGNVQLNHAIESGLNFNTIQKKSLSKTTYSGVKEFTKYNGWSTEKLIYNAYERLSTLKKLQASSAKINIHARLQNLFKYLMVLMAHINGEHLTIKSSTPTKNVGRTPTA